MLVKAKASPKNICFVSYKPQKITFTGVFCLNKNNSFCANDIYF